MNKVSLINIETNDLAKYREDCFAEIKKDTPFYGILLNGGFGDDSIKANIGKVHTYYEDYKRWQTIKTYDDVLKTGERYSYNLKFDGYHILRESEILKPFQEYIEYTSKFIYKDFPDSFNNVSLKDVDSKVLKSKIFSALKMGNWIYITGAIRSGRTYCAIAIINVSASRGNTNLAFLDSAKEIRELANLFFDNQNSFINEFNKLKNSHLLVLDGFGNEYVNDIVRDSIIIPLLQYRAQNNLMTIFTSDFDIEDLLTLYSKKDSNNVRTKQLSSILHSKIPGEIITSKKSIY